MEHPIMPPRELPDHVNLIGFAFGREPWATWLQQGGCLESAHCELSDLMLAVLAHWGRPATPPPEPPTDEKLLALQEKLWDEYKIIPYQGGEFMSDDGFRHALSDYRAALERWGHR